MKLLTGGEGRWLWGGEGRVSREKCRFVCAGRGQSNLLGTSFLSCPRGKDGVVEGGITKEQVTHLPRYLPR